MDNIKIGCKLLITKNIKDLTIFQRKNEGVMELNDRQKDFVSDLQAVMTEHEVLLIDGQDKKRIFIGFLDGKNDDFTVSSVSPDNVLFEK